LQTWNLNEIETPGGRTSPVVLFSDDSRAVVIGLEPGQELGEHEVRERAWLTVLDGSVEIEREDGSDWVEGSAGTLVTFAPGERRSVRSRAGARLLLLLAPWPGDGHYLPGEVPNAFVRRDRPERG
jgi:quercetin dioxygenase-like cupin family protein